MLKILFFLKRNKVYLLITFCLCKHQITIRIMLDFISDLLFLSSPYNYLHSLRNHDHICSIRIRMH